MKTANPWITESKNSDENYLSKIFNGVFLAEKIHKRIEHFRALIKEKGDEYREFLQEELKEFEILLYYMVKKDFVLK